MSTADHGARRRAAQRRAPRPDPALLTGLVLVLLAGAAVLLTLPARVAGGADAGTDAAVGAFVDHAVVVCPDEEPGRGTTTSVQLGLAPAQGEVRPAEGGIVRQGPVGSAAGKPLDLPRGVLASVAGSGGPAVEADGGAAAGLFGVRTDARGQALGVASCVTPRAQWWFTGAGAGLDHSSSLLLANVDPGPAVVDLRVLGPDGEVDTVATTGITIAPHTVHRVDLSDIAPQTDDLAVSVHANRGRVAAHVTDTYRGRTTGPSGQEWLAGTELPSRTLRLAGLPARSRSTALLVANPSELEAVVEVRIAGRSGTFAPSGLEPVTVPPGAVRTVDLGESLPRREAVALRLRSRVPVVASARAVVPGDHLYAVPVSPLVGPAAAVLPRGADSSVQLTAGAVPADVSVTSYTAGGDQVERADLRIDPTATRAWSPRRRADYVVVAPSTAPGAGVVHGGVVHQGDGVAAGPLTALPLRVVRPVVRPGVG
jgi:hypothetical protein